MEVKKIQFGIVKPAIIAIRCIQMLCIAFMITGFIWASSDYLLVTALVNSPVAPFSLLLMLYGTMGLGFTEVAARILSRKAKDGKN